MASLHKKIILVEDDRFFAKMVLDHLHEHFQGHLTIEHASSLREFLTYKAKGKFDLIVLDLNLPDSSDLQTLQHAKEQYPNTPIVVLTALGNKLISEFSISNGALDYIVKDKQSVEQITRKVNLLLFDPTVQKP